MVLVDEANGSLGSTVSFYFSVSPVRAVHHTPFQDPQDPGAVRCQDVGLEPYT